MYSVFGFCSFLLCHLCAVHLFVWFHMCESVCMCRSWLFASFKDRVKQNAGYSGKYQYHITVRLGVSILFSSKHVPESRFIYYPCWWNLLPLFHYIVLVAPALSNGEENNTSSFRKYIIYFLTNHALFLYVLTLTSCGISRFLLTIKCLWDDLDPLSFVSFDILL